MYRSSLCFITASFTFIYAHFLVTEEANDPFLNAIRGQSDLITGKDQRPLIVEPLSTQIWTVPEPKATINAPLYPNRITSLYPSPNALLHSDQTAPTSSILQETIAAMHCSESIESQAIHAERVAILSGAPAMYPESVAGVASPLLRSTVQTDDLSSNAAKSNQIPALSALEDRPCSLDRSHANENSDGELYKSLQIHCPHSTTVSFLIVGRWNRCAQTPFTAAIQSEMARLLSSDRKMESPDFVVSIGATYITDQPCPAQDYWSYLWGNRSVPWLSAIGPHHHDQELEDQVAYSKTHANWNIPSANYVVDVQLADSSLRLIVLDTTRISEATIQWLTQKLEGNKLKESIVVGFHDIYAVSGDSKDELLMKLRKCLKDVISGAVAYISAEEQDLEYLTKSGVTFLISGGGEPALIGKKRTPHTSASIKKAILAHGLMRYAYDSKNSDSAVSMCAYDDDGNFSGEFAQAPLKTAMHVAREFARVVARKVFPSYHK